MPARIQRSRTKGGGMPPGAVYIGRPGRWGNPWHVIYRPDTGGWHIVHNVGSDAGIGTWPTRQAATIRATAAYQVWLHLPEQADYRGAARNELAGRDLACWCPAPADGEPDHCHGAVLLAVARGEAP